MSQIYSSYQKNSNCQKSKSKYKTNASGSKLKDKINLTMQQKVRSANRKSIKLNYAPIVFHDERRISKKSDKGMLIGRNSGSMRQLEALVDQRLEKMNQNYKILQLSIQNIKKYEELKIGLKKAREEGREFFLKSKQAQRKQEKQLQQAHQQRLRLKFQIDRIHYQFKKYMYEFVSKSEQLKKRNLDYRIMTQERVIFQNQWLKQLGTMNEAFVQQGIRAERLQEERLQYSKFHAEKLKFLNIQLAQLFVLKFQINSDVFSGMVACFNKIDKKLLLQNEYTNWDRAKQRKITYKDLKRFILIQLYRGWKNILRKLSYQSSQYQVLFGQLNDQPIVDDLKRFLTEDIKIRASQKKIQKHLIFYSEVETDHNRKQIIRNELQGFDNGIIRINKTLFVENQGTAELQIYYNYLHEEEVVEKFIYEEYNFINKQNLVKDFKATDKKIFCMVEIPLFFHRQNESRYQQAFQLIKRQHGRKKRAISNNQIIALNKTMSQRAMSKQSK